MILTILLTSAALAILALLIFNLAVYAWPCFAGVSAASLPHARESELVGAAIVPFCAGAPVLVPGGKLLATSRTPLLHLACFGDSANSAAMAGHAITCRIGG